MCEALACRLQVGIAVRVKEAATVPEALTFCVLF